MPTTRTRADATGKYSISLAVRTGGSSTVFICSHTRQCSNPDWTDEDIIIEAYCARDLLAGIVHTIHLPWRSSLSPSIEYSRRGHHLCPLDHIRHY